MRALDFRRADDDFSSFHCRATFAAAMIYLPFSRYADADAAAFMLV